MILFLYTAETSISNGHQGLTLNTEKCYIRIYLLAYNILFEIIDIIQKIQYENANSKPFLSAVLRAFRQHQQISGNV
jgi:hypothetical protein